MEEFFGFIICVTIIALGLVFIVKNTKIKK
jgi:hypothetical protein